MLHSNASVSCYNVVVNELFQYVSTSLKQTPQPSGPGSVSDGFYQILRKIQPVNSRMRHILHFSLNYFMKDNLTNIRHLFFLRHTR